MYIRKTDLYFYGLGLMAIGLPVSEFLMSLSMFLLAIAWLLNGPKGEQWKAFRSNKLAWSGVILFLLPFISLLWTSNTGQALHDLRIKLPLLLVPIFISATSISLKQFHTLLGLLIGSTFVGTVILFINYHINLKEELLNIREVSIFISHIRFSLIIAVCIYILLYAAYKWRNTYSFLVLILAVWFGYFIFFLGSGNGFIGLGLVFIFSIIGISREIPLKGLSYSLAFLSISFVSYVIYLGVISYSSHFIVKDHPYNQQEVKQKYDSDYFSVQDDMQLENGYLIWRNVSNEQMEIAWAEVGGIEYQEKDQKGQPILGTLTRYLTSLALPKDSIGVYQLKKEDIENIERGYFRFDQKNWNNLHLRVHQFFYQLMAFKYQNEHGNKPLLQRLYYWSTAIKIIKEHPLFGIGNGDIKDEFNRVFEKDDSKLGKSYRHTTHNQYLTYFVTTGVFGFLLFILAVFYPLVIFTRNNSILTFAQLILLISFISEDTLETQPGVTMYVLFLALGIALLNKKPIQTEYPLSSAEA